MTAVVSMAPNLGAMETTGEPFVHAPPLVHGAPVLESFQRHALKVLNQGSIMYVLGFVEEAVLCKCIYMLRVPDWLCDVCDVVPPYRSCVA